MSEANVSESEATEFDFVLNADASLANALRRTMIGKVPSVSIDTVTIKENDSVLSDEIIAHRLGMIPLRLDPGCTRKEHKVKLELTGPCRVYSGDLMFTPGISVVSKTIIIMNLGAHEQVKLVGNTEEGIGADHSKWSVCCGTSYKKLEDDKFKFHIEVHKGISAKDTLIKAIDIIRADVVRYKKLL